MCDISTTMSPTIGALAAALAKAQGTFTFAAKTSEASVSYGGKTANVRKYADLAAVLDAVRSGLSANGIAVIQTPFSQQGGGVLLRTTLAHSSGEWMASEISLPPDRMGGIQGWGSALTYARRYALAAMVGIAQDDDDGQAAQDAEPRNKKAREQAHKEVQRAAEAANPDAMTREQAQALMIRLRSRGCDTQDKYLHELSSFLGREVKTSKELTQDDFRDYMQATEPQGPELDNPF